MAIYAEAGIRVCYYRKALPPAPLSSSHVSSTGGLPHPRFSPSLPRVATPPDPTLLYHDPKGLKRDNGLFITGFTVATDLGHFQEPTPMADSSPSSQDGAFPSTPMEASSHSFFSGSVTWLEDYELNQEPSAGMASSGSTASARFFLPSDEALLNAVKRRGAAADSDTTIPLFQKVMLLRKLLDDFQKANLQFFDNNRTALPLEPPFDGLVLCVEPDSHTPTGKTQQFWWKNGHLQNLDLRADDDWSLAAYIASNCVGEQGTLEFLPPTLKFDTPRWKEWTFTTAKLAAIVWALFAAAKPLPGIHSFFKPLIKLTASWIVAAIGSTASVLFYVMSNQKISVAFLRATLIPRPLEAIYLSNESGVSPLFPSYQKNLRARFFDLLFGLGYALSNLGLVLKQTAFLMAIPPLRPFFLMGTFITNLLVGTDKSFQITLDWTALLQRLSGTRNPAFAAEKKLLDHALASLSAGLSLYGEKRVRFEKSRLSPYQKDLKLETYNKIREEINAHIASLRCLCRMPYHPLHIVLKEIANRLRILEEDMAIMDTKMEVSRCTPSSTTTTLSTSKPRATDSVDEESILLPTREALTEEMIQTIDARREKPSYFAVFSGVNGGCAYLKECLATFLSIGFSVAGGFSNISGNYTLWSMLPNNFMRLAMSIFCTLAVFGLNKEAFDRHCNFILKESGHPTLVVGYEAQQHRTLKERFFSEIKKNPSLFVAMIISFIQGAAGWYYCVSSPLLTLALRKFAGLVTAYAMTTTKIYATQMLGLQIYQWASNGLNATFKKISRKKQNPLTPMPIKTYGLTTKFYDEQIQLFIDQISRLVEQYNKKLSLNSIHPNDLPGPSFFQSLQKWARSLATNQFNMQLSLDPAIQIRLQLQHINIQHEDPHGHDDAYLADINRAIKQTQEGLRQNAALKHPGDTDQQEFYYAERIRPALIKTLHAFFDDLSVKIQAMDLPKSAFAPGDRQQCPHNHEGHPTPPTPFNENHMTSARREQTALYRRAASTTPSSFFAA